MLLYFVICSSFTYVFLELFVCQVIDLHLILLTEVTDESKMKPKALRLIPLTNKLLLVTAFNCVIGEN